MRLKLTTESEFFDARFAQWLITRVQEVFYTKLDKNKLVKWNTFFDNSTQFNTITGKPFDTEQVVLFAIKSLIYEVESSELTIKFSPNKLVPNLDRVKVEMIVKTINFGTAEITGYPIFTETFDAVADNINNYVEEYVNLWL